MRIIALVSSVIFLVSGSIGAQEFLFGADLSYANEMNDCGAVFTVDGTEKDVYEIFAENNCGIVRLRKWHTPSWYDDLNDGNRYSDLQDIERAIQRAKDNGMQVLLDFHLSDNWADPGKQVVPSAWAPVVDSLDVLKDSLYNYLYNTLDRLHGKGLLPEMVQIGNETNKGILQSQEDNDSGWKLEWDRNSALFNAGIKAVRDISDETGEDIKIMVHVAGPGTAEWLFPQFIQNGVVDFDIMGVSYYWAWHKPIDIVDAGDIISELRSKFPDYEVMIAETGYIWTWDSNDGANNIINEVHPDYSPPSPEAQRDWLVDMTAEMMSRGCTSVMYWEPAWVSTGCWTQWGRGSHQEHATFFDFDNELLDNGGMDWMTHDYTSSSSDPVPADNPMIYWDSINSILKIEVGTLASTGEIDLRIFSTSGVQISQKQMQLVTGLNTVEFSPSSPGMYVAVISDDDGIISTLKFIANL